ncbi:MAG: LysR family transcriptional regulator [Pseudomonadota bacterium]
MSKSLDRLSLLTTFVRIAERGSISAAARDLGLSQASASRHLNELETRLGTVLIERTTHNLSLT